MKLCFEFRDLRITHKAEGQRAAHMHRGQGRGPHKVSGAKRAWTSPQAPQLQRSRKAALPSQALGHTDTAVDSSGDSATGLWWGHSYPHKESKRWRTQGQGAPTRWLYVPGTPAPSKSKKQGPRLESKTSEGRRGEISRWFSTVVILNPKSWRSHRRDDVLPLARLGSCYQTESRLETEVKCNYR